MANATFVSAIAYSLYGKATGAPPGTTTARQGETQMHSRRQVMAQIGGLGALSILAAPTILRASTSGARSFRIIRSGTVIGHHTVALRRIGDEIQAAIEIEIKVKVFGIAAYRYEMTNRETWRAGRLIGLDSKVNDDGDAAFARAKTDGDRLVIDGSAYQGIAPVNVATTSYWSHDFLNRPVWISTQTGALQAVTVSRTGAGTTQSTTGEVKTEQWAVRGDFEVDLHYAGREWAALAFDAGGETAIYTPDAVGPTLQPVWDATS
jgi:hypothetical protein